MLKKFLGKSLRDFGNSRATLFAQITSKVHRNLELIYHGSE